MPDSDFSEGESDSPEKQEIRNSKFLEFDEEKEDDVESDEQMLEEKETKSKQKQATPPTESFVSRERGRVKGDAEENVETKRTTIERPHTLNPEATFAMASFPKDLQIEMDTPYSPKPRGRDVHSANCIRWRYKDDETDPNAILVEGNSRIVEWEDGSVTLYVGNSSFEGIKEKETTSLLQKSDIKESVHTLAKVVQQRYLFKSSMYKRNMQLLDQTKKSIQF